MIIPMEKINLALREAVKESVEKIDITAARVLTAKDAAAYLGVSEHIFRKIKLSYYLFEGLKRYSIKDLEEYKESRRVKVR